MKRILFVALLTVLASFAAHGQDCSGAAALQKHIYKPERLVEQKPCITVRGIIRNKASEGDGDYHVRLELDNEQPNGLTKSELLNARNLDSKHKGQHGMFVFEPLCVNDVKQDTAWQACNVKNKDPKKHWKQKISLPNDGDHVEVTGVWVLDTDAGHGWFEIHPVTKIVKIP